MPAAAPTPTPADFSKKWNIRFADNEFQNITEATFRAFAADIAVTFGVQLVNVPAYQLGATYQDGYLVRFTPDGGKESFFYSLLAGILPAPTTDPADKNWRLVPGPVATTVLSQELTLAQAQAIEGLVVMPGRTYLIDFGPDAAGHAQVVTLLGTAANLFAIRGQLTVAGVRSNVRVNVASGVFGLEAFDLLTTPNLWLQVNDFSKGIKLPLGGFVDEIGHFYIRQVDVGQKHFMFGPHYSLARDGIIQWKDSDFIGQDGDGDVGLARNAPGVLEVNTGTRGYVATLLSKDVVALAAPYNLNSISLLAQAVLDTGLLKGAKILWVCGGLSFYSPQRGNPSRPYPTTQQAHDEATSGDLIMVQAGGTGTDALGRAYYTEDFLWTRNVRIVFQPGAIHGGLFQLSRFGDADPATLFKRQLTGGEFTNRTLAWRHSAGDLAVEVTGATFTGNGNFEVAGGGSYNNNFLTTARLRNCLFDVNITNTTLGALRVTGRDDMGPVGAVLENTRIVSVRTPTLTFAANAASFVTLQGALTELVGTAPETRPTVPSGYVIAQKEWLLDQRQGVGSSPGGTTTTELQLYTADSTARVVALALTKALTLLSASAIAARNVQAISYQVNAYASGNWVAGAERFSLPDAQADVDALTASQYEQGAELLFKITAVDGTKPARGLVTINRA